MSKHNRQSRLSNAQVVTIAQAEEIQAVPTNETPSVTLETPSQNAPEAQGEAIGTPDVSQEVPTAGTPQEATDSALSPIQQVDQAMPRAKSEVARRLDAIGEEISAELKQDGIHRLKFYAGLGEKAQRFVNISVRELGPVHKDLASKKAYRANAIAALARRAEEFGTGTDFNDPNKWILAAQALAIAPQLATYSYGSVLSLSPLFTRLESEECFDVWIVTQRYAPSLQTIMTRFMEYGTREAAKNALVDADRAIEQAALDAMSPKERARKEREAAEAKAAAVSQAKMACVKNFTAAANKLGMTGQDIASALSSARRNQNATGATETRPHDMDDETAKELAEELLRAKNAEAIVTLYRLIEVPAKALIAAEISRPKNAPVEKDPIRVVAMATA